MWGFDKGRKGMYGITVVPFPAEYDFLVSFEVPRGKNSECEGGFIWRSSSLRCLFVTRRWTTEDGTQNGVRPASVPHKSGGIACYPCIEGEVKGRPNEMDEWFGHAKVGISVQRIGEIDGRGGYGASKWCNELVGGDGLGGMDGIRRWANSRVFCGKLLDSDGRRGPWFQCCDTTPVLSMSTKLLARRGSGDDILSDRNVRVGAWLVNVDYDVYVVFVGVSSTGDGGSPFPFGVGFNNSGARPSMFAIDTWAHPPPLTVPLSPVFQ